MKRVAVFGNAGGGKSTLARRLAELTRLPLYAIDVFQFREGGEKLSQDEHAGQRTPVEEDVAVIVPAGARHNLFNTGDEPLLLYTLYAPPEHRDGLVQKTKKEAEGQEEHFDGRTTE